MFEQVLNFGFYHYTIARHSIYDTRSTSTSTAKLPNEMMPRINFIFILFCEWFLRPLRGERNTNKRKKKNESKC